MPDRMRTDELQTFGRVRDLNGHMGLRSRWATEVCRRSLRHGVTGRPGCQVGATGWAPPDGLRCCRVGCGAAGWAVVLPGGLRSRRQDPIYTEPSAGRSCP
ncbi:hypothetical protein GCM10009625_34340 [Brachybacterium fresconis]